MKFISNTEYDSLLATQNQLEAILKSVGNPENKTSEELAGIVQEQLEKIPVLEENAEKMEALQGIEEKYNQLDLDHKASLKLITDKDAEIEDIAGKLEKANTDLDTANAEIERLGKQPGATPTAVEKDKDVTHEADPVESEADPKSFKGNLNPNSPMMAKAE